MPLSWGQGRAFRCFDNVQEVVQKCGGQAIFGWALADFGPISRSGNSERPLYRRWANHVVWSDEENTLWEVTPCFDLLDPRNLAYLPVEFLPDPSATFHVVSEGDWSARPSRFFPVCSTGEEIARLLTQAQQAGLVKERSEYLDAAVSILRTLGYSDVEWRVDVRLKRTVGIWLVAD